MSSSMFDNLITDRIVEMTFKPVCETGRWLERIGMEVTSREDGVVVLRNPYLDYTTALNDAIDPVNRAITIAFLLLGVVWPQICPGLPEQTHREWKRRRQAAQQEREGVG